MMSIHIPATSRPALREQLRNNTPVHDEETDTGQSSHDLPDHQDSPTTANLRALHQQATQGRSTYPGTRSVAKNKRRDSDSIEVTVSDSQSDSSSAEESSSVMTPDVVRRKIRKLQRRCEAEEARGREKAAQKLQSEIDKLKTQLNQMPIGQRGSRGKKPIVKAVSPVPPQASPSIPATSDDLNKLCELIIERRDKVCALTQTILALEETAKVDGDTTDIDKARQELAELQTELQCLDGVMQLLASRIDESGVSPDSAKSLYRSTLDPTLKTTTTTTTTVAKTPSKLADMHENARNSERNSLRNSSLLLNEDLRQYFSETALEEIQVIDREIESRIARADELQDSARRLLKKVDESEEVGGETPKKLHTLRNKDIKAAAAEWVAIGKLIERRQAMEAKVLPHPIAELHRHNENEFQAFILRFKSEETLAREKKHQEALAKLGPERESSAYSNMLWNLAAGASGFMASFLISNTASRLLPLESEQWLRVIGPPLVAGTLHVIAATPVVKQVMTQTWSSPSLAALNHNFKLRGAAWRDWWTGQESVKKYDSINPDNKQLLTIKERMAEEASFCSLLGARYVDEEASYYFYTLNYLFKAAAAATMAPYLAGGSFDSKLWESGLHGFAGLCSGAEYVFFQQQARSQRNNAKASPVPTREIFKLEAEALESLKNDLQVAIANAEVQGPNDDTHRKLAKALRRTEKARLAAALKSKHCGIIRHEFWAQFSKEARRDTLSEVLGRAISLLPVAGVSELTASWRKSPDPVMMFLGHMLPAIVLIVPPGWTLRPVYSGLIRALLQAFESVQDRKRPEAKQAAADAGGDGSEIITISDDGAESVVITIDSDESDSEDAWHGNPKEGDDTKGGW